MRNSQKFLKIAPALFLLVIFFAVDANASDDISPHNMGQRMTRLVLELAVIIITARSLGYFFQRVLKQPSVLGELCAGMIIGPYALGSFELPVIGSLFSLPHGAIAVSPELYGIATVASIILLFLVGLETDLATFLRYSAAGSVVGIGGLVASFVLGDLAAVVFGIAENYMSPSALFLGAISTATSVGITARILSEKRKLDSPEGVTILSGAVIDDVLGIIAMAVIIGISKNSGGSESGVDWKHILFIAVKAFGFWIVCTVGGLLLARKITGFLKWFKSEETIAAVSLGLALLLAGLSELAGLAMIIGAYITGLSLSRTDVVNELHNRLRGIYQILVPVFFCVMGMIVDFKAMKGAIVFGIVYTLLAIAGKVLGCGIPALFLKFNFKGALRIGVGMMPRGEVALIIAGIGLSTGTIGPEVFGVAIMMTLITTLIAPPMLIKAFGGGAGTSKTKGGELQEFKLTLSLPHVDIAEFVTSRLVNAFRREAFFVHRVGTMAFIYQLRKDDMLMTLTRRGPNITIEAAPKHECIARYIIAEEMLELEEAFESLKSMGGTSKLCQELILGGER